MLIHFVAKFSIVRFRIQAARYWIFRPVMRNGCDAVRCAVRAGPNDVRLAEPFEYVLRRDRANVRVPIDVAVFFVPFDAIYFVARRFESLADAACACE